MKKRWIGSALALLTLALGLQGAAAQTLSFPYAGVRLDAQEAWVVLTPGRLEEEGALLDQLGVTAQALEADYAANHTAFEVYLPQGGQVSLSAVQTEQTAQWGAVVYMAEDEKEALLTSFMRAPYENVAWAETPGWLSCEWTLQAGGVPVSFVAQTTVRNGCLYTLTAAGAQRPADALAEDLAAVRDAITFQESALPTSGLEQAGPAVVAPIADDGVVTPIALVDFSSVSYEETTEIIVQTLPGAELLLHTATDSLRGRADEAGLHRYQVSTKRETVYTYRLTVASEGRDASEVEIVIERQLTPEAREEAYKRSARQIGVYGYSNLIGAPESFADKPVTFRGRVGGYADLEGFPCVLIYTDNPGRGIWRNPVWVMLTQAQQLEMDEIYTVYGDLRGDTLPYDSEEDAKAVAPVVISREITG